jgi:hypothetical protein
LLQSFAHSGQIVSTSMYSTFSTTSGGCVITSTNFLFVFRSSIPSTIAVDRATPNATAKNPAMNLLVTMFPFWHLGLVTIQLLCVQSTTCYLYTTKVYGGVCRTRTGVTGLKAPQPLPIWSNTPLGTGLCSSSLSPERATDLPLGSSLGCPV